MGAEYLSRSVPGTMSLGGTFGAPVGPRDVDQIVLILKQRREDVTMEFESPRGRDVFAPTVTWVVHVLAGPLLNVPKVVVLRSNDQYCTVYFHSDHVVVTRDGWNHITDDAPWLLDAVNQYYNRDMSTEFEVAVDGGNQNGSFVGSNENPME
jgi:hypothetical protein